MTAGEQIAYLGDSGDAEGNHHLHFEVHPNDGADVIRSHTSTPPSASCSPAGSGRRSRSVCAAARSRPAPESSSFARRRCAGGPAGSGPRLSGSVCHPLAGARRSRRHGARRGAPEPGAASSPGPAAGLVVTAYTARSRSLPQRSAASRARSWLPGSPAPGGRPSRPTLPIRSTRPTTPPRSTGEFVDRRHRRRRRSSFRALTLPRWRAATRRCPAPAAPRRATRARARCGGSRRSRPWAHPA